MKILSKIILLSFFLFLFTATTCDENEPVTCEEFLEELEVLKTEIDSLIASSSCSENAECRSIAFGSKPCGGPWSYLVYSTSIDTNKLAQLVNDYNTLENDYNNICGISSDCMIVSPPSEIICEDSACIIVN